MSLTRKAGEVEMICPCKGCDKAGCGDYHDRCEEYQAWSAERNEIHRQLRMENIHRQLSRSQEVKHWHNLKEGRTVSKR